MLKTVFKLWHKHTSQVRGVPAYVYASDEETARSKLAARISINSEVLDPVLTLDPDQLRVGTASKSYLVETGGVNQYSPRLSKETLTLEDVLTPEDWEELQADSAS